MKLTPYEKEVIRRMLHEISREYANNPDMESDSFAWLLWQKIEYAMHQLRDNRDRDYLRLLSNVIPEKRGKEQCDCKVGQPSCGCRVSEYNQAIEEVQYAVGLVRKAIMEDE